MEFTLISIKQRNFLARIFDIYNYQVVVKYNDFEYKFNIRVTKDEDTYSILRSVKRGLEKKLAEDSFDFTFKDVKKYEEKVITEEDIKY